LPLGLKTCLEKEKSESFWKLKDNVCCLETATSRPRWFKWALYPQILPCLTYSSGYSCTFSTLTV